MQPCGGFDLEMQQMQKKVTLKWDTTSVSLGLICSELQMSELWVHFI